MSYFGNTPSPVPLNEQQIADAGDPRYVNTSGDTVTGDISFTGNTTANTFTATSLKTPAIIAGDNIQSSVASISWSANTDSYFENKGLTSITTIHEKMRRCTLHANGSVNYYLDSANSSLKADGSASTLTGADGFVMVEIPKFYYSYSRVNNVLTWRISEDSLPGMNVHPAFIKNGVEVDNRYIGAYDACVQNANTGSYVSGLNLDDASGRFNTGTDKLASVSGIYPMVGLTRNEARLMAANVGTGWRQFDFWLMSAIQMLYLIEYGNFNSQTTLGNGNGNVSTGYPASSASQTDSPHSVAGKSNFLGNRSTNNTTGASSATRDVAFMSYRGIENLFGNAWNWIDGVNINVSSTGNVHVSNTDTDFADDTATNYTLLTSSLPTSSEYIRDLLDISGAFLPSSVSGGSSSTFISDYFYGSATSNRILLFGGNANNGAIAGAFFLNGSVASSTRSRDVSARVAF